MEFGKAQILGIVWVIVIALGLLFYIIGFSTEEWLTLTASDLEKFHYGLWRICWDIFCVDMDHLGTFGGEFDGNGGYSNLFNPTWLKATRAMAALGLICLLVATVTTAISFIFVVTSLSSRKVLVMMIAVISTFAAGLFIFITIVVFAAESINHVDTDIPLYRYYADNDETSEDYVSFDTKLGYSYGLTIVGLLFVLAAGGVGIANILRHRGESSDSQLLS
jgi:magnesium-transporting ATPase (P-type)